MNGGGSKRASLSLGTLPIPHFPGWATPGWSTPGRTTPGTDEGTPFAEWGMSGEEKRRRKRREKKKRQEVYVSPGIFGGVCVLMVVRVDYDARCGDFAEA